MLWDLSFNHSARSLFGAILTRCHIILGVEQFVVFSHFSASVLLLLRLDLMMK